MRSVLTILILLIVVGCVVLYTTKGMDGFQGESLGPAAQEAAIKEMVEHPCSTDLDCPTGHCSMFGLCTNSLSL
jgi:hypothetical protein